MKKSICLVLSVLFAFTSFPCFGSALQTDTAVPFSYTVYAEQPSYEKGEDIKIRVCLKNMSLSEITDMRIWMEYPLTDYYLTPGVTERFIQSLGESAEGTLRIAEDEGVLAFASKADSNAFIRKILLRLAHAYKKLTLAFATVRYGIQNTFVSVMQHTVELGTVTVLYDNTEIECTVRCRYSVHPSEEMTAVRMSDETGLACAEIKAEDNAYTGIAFAMTEDGEKYGLFVMHPDTGTVRLYDVRDGGYALLAKKVVPIESDSFYTMKVLFDNNRVICYLSYNLYDAEPYPVFDLAYETDGSGYGVFCHADGYGNFSVIPTEMPSYEKTYTNPVYGNAADPYILRDGDTYYLYATTNSRYGFHVSVSTDLVNWENLGYCAKKGDIYGSEKFWAPEVYHYNGKYYLLYSTDEHPALAVADTPTGPFMKTKDGYLLEDACIDGHFLFDEDGAVYMYMAYWAETGEEIWGCRMKNDLSGAVPGTLTQLTTCKEDEDGVNEGPCVLKYKGKYYLTYSVNGYTSQSYCVRLAVSDFPLGNYVGKGTILEKCGTIVGTGHHSFIASPDGSELFIAYHCHCSTTSVHDRKLCIDRCAFVETQDGYTIGVYGPTSTAQAYPSDNSAE